MLIAARNSFMAGGGWKNPYITDGLVAMWDGEWNVGGGVHDPNLVGITELISGRFVEVTEIGDNFAILKANVGYNESYGNRPNSVTIECCGCVFGSGWGEQGNPMFNPIWAIEANRAGYYAGKSFSTSSTWVSNGWLDWWNALASDSVVRLSCDGATTILSVKEGKSRRSYSGGFGSVMYINFCTQRGDTSMPNVFHCARIYSRVLEEDEIAANYAVDKARFNLPDAS